MNTRRARLQKELNTTQYRPCDATNILKQDLRAPQLCFLVIDNVCVWYCGSCCGCGLKKVVL
jgi:hypothetical protein